MKFYKIRHIPTGLFYKPSKHRSKVNLSKNGKTYQMKPSIERYVGGSYRHPRPKLSQEELKTMSWFARYDYRQGYITKPVVPEEWEIVEYEVTE